MALSHGHTEKVDLNKQLALPNTAVLEIYLDWAHSLSVAKIAASTSTWSWDSRLLLML